MKWIIMLTALGSLAACMEATPITPEPAVHAPGSTARASMH